MYPLIIATVDKTLYSGDVVLTTCPGSEGELTIMANHTPLITTLKKGTITVKESRDADPETFDVERGLLEVANNRATILI